MTSRQFAAAILVVASMSRPASLLAEEHPLLYVGPDDRAWILERIERSPFDEWWEAARNGAVTGLSFDVAAHTDHHSRSPVARDLGFAAWVEDDPRYVPKAVEIMTDIDPHVGWGQGHRAGASAFAYAEAYDFLAASGFLDPVDDEAIRQRLLITIERMDTNPVIEAIPNNWKIRYFSGAAALCLVVEDGGSEHDAREVAVWRDRAVERVLRTIVIQEVDGAWAEGGHYLTYSASTYLRLFDAWERRFGLDFLDTDPMIRIHDFVVDWALPSGLAPNVDDASLADFPSGLVAHHQPEFDEHMWSASRDGSWVDGGELRLMAICAHPEPDAGRAPDRDPDLFRPKAGAAIFRSGWSADDSHLLVLGEHGDARTMGLRHEHADGTSLTLWKGDVPLLLDGGYHSWEGRQLVAGPEHHNLVLVDGKGPAEPTVVRPTRGVDAWLSGWVDEDTLGSVTVSTTHHRTEMERSVTHVRNDWITVVDDLTTVSWRARTFTHLLHGNGEESLGTFESTPDGGRWFADGLEMSAQVLAPIGVSLETARDLHSLAYRDTTGHTVLRSSMDGWYTRFIVTVSYGAEGQVRPPRVIRGEAGFALSRQEGMGTDILLVADEAQTGTSVDMPGIGWIESSADRLYLRVEGGQVHDAVALAGPAELAIDGCSVSVRLPAMSHGHRKD